LLQTVIGASVALARHRWLRLDASGMEMDENQKNMIDRAVYLRGRIITQFAQYEYLLADISVMPATQTDANREFKSPRRTEWQWFVIALVAFAIMDYLGLQSWG
jgi:hypothetical protein